MSLAACAATLVAQAATIPAPHILILEDESAERAAFVGFMQGFRRGLEPLGAAVVYIENLDLARFPARSHLERQRDWLKSKYRDVRIDIVVTGGARALDYALRERPQLFPGAQILFAADVVPSPAMADVSGTFVGVDVRAGLRDAMALLPQTRHVALVADAIDDMSYWRTLREDLEALPQGVALIALEGLPVDELKQRVAALPPDSLIFYTRQIRDRDGRQYGQADILDALVRFANAPVFGQVAWQMGHGIVGGRLVDPDKIGRKTAALVLRLAGGERAGSIPVDRSAVYPAVYDARELRRWGIDRERLPPDSTVVFEPPSLWREKRGLVIGIVAALLMQSALIGALLWERRRRRRTENELRQRTQEIALLNRSAALGEVSAAIAHEVNQPLGSIVLNAEAADRLLAADGPAVDEAREILQDIRRDGRRAGEIVHKVRQLFRRADAEAQRVSMNRIVRDVVEIAKADRRFSGVQIDLDLAADLPRLAGDRVQLQQVTFNLMTNAADAVQAMPEGPRRIKLRTSPQQDTGRMHVLLEVIDTGAGLPADGFEDVFEPFVSGKADGMGVGLSISRSIAAAHGGTLTAHHVDEGGACFRLSIPALSA